MSEEKNLGDSLFICDVSSLLIPNEGKGIVQILHIVAYPLT